MSVIVMLATIAIIGILAWALQQMPIEATIKKVLFVVLVALVCILVVAWLAAALGHPILNIRL